MNRNHNTNHILHRLITLVVTTTLGACAADVQDRRSTAAGDRKSEDNVLGEVDKQLVGSATASRRSITPLSIDAGAYTMNSDGFVSASTWAGGCPGAPILFDQALTGYINGRHHIWDTAYGAFRAVSIGFVATAGTSFDLTRKCNGPDTYPEASFFSFGSSKAGTPVVNSMHKIYQASEDGFVSAAIWTPNGGGHQAISGLVADTSVIVDSEHVVAFEADWGSYRTTSITFPVKKGQYYVVKPFTLAPGTYPHMTFTPVAGLGLGSYESAAVRDVATAPADGFVIASAWTGACRRDGYTFQQVDGVHIGENGAIQRVAVKAVYGEWRATSIIMPVLKGTKYKVGFYCTDGYSKAQVKFVALDD